MRHAVQLCAHIASDDAHEAFFRPWLRVAKLHDGLFVARRKCAELLCDLLLKHDGGFGSACLTGALYWRSLP